MDAYYLLPAIFEINDMQSSELKNLQHPRKSGYRQTFDICIKSCIYFMHVCTGNPSHDRSIS